MTLQGTHLPTGTAGRGFQTAKGRKRNFNGYWERRDKLNVQGIFGGPDFSTRCLSKETKPWPALRRTAACWATHLPCVYSRGLPCHPQCPGCTALKEMELLVLSQCSQHRAMCKRHRTPGRLIHPPPNQWVQASL